MLLNVSSPSPPNTVSCGLDAQKQTETDAGEGGREATWSLHRRAALNIKLWLTFRFYGKTFTIEKIFPHSQSPLSTFSHSLSIFLCLSVSLCLLARAGLQKFIMLLKDIGEGLCKTLASAIN